MVWIDTDKMLPPENEWVLVRTGDANKPIDVMQYQGMKVGRYVGQSNFNLFGGNGYEKFVYPQWTRGRGDILGTHPIAWASLREVW